MLGKFYDEKTLKKLQSIELEILRDFVDLCDRHNLIYFGVGGTAIGAIRHSGFIPWDDDIDIALPRDDYEKFLRYAKKEYSDKYLIVNGVEYPNFPFLTTRWTMKGTEFVEWPMKDVDCPNGIFLDIYPFDQIPDDEKKVKRQAIQSFFWSKLLILRSIPDPVLPVGGLLAKIITFICGIIHWFLKTFKVSKKWLHKMCLATSRQYNGKGDTKRFGFICDTTAYTSVYYMDEVYPLRTIRFEDIDLNFPGQVEKSLERAFGDFMQLPPEEKRKNHYPYKLDFGIKE